MAFEALQVGCQRAIRQHYKTNSCAAHASCGAKPHILNWTKISVDDYKAQGGIAIEKADRKKVAKKL